MKSMNSLKNTTLKSLVLLVFLLSINTTYASGPGDGNGNIRCIERERLALLTFKRGLIDRHNLLSSWGNEEDEKECCKWRGIKCSNRTGHVIALQLNPEKSKYSLEGKLDPALTELQHLNLLDLSRNVFDEQIPSFIATSFKKLKHLYLRQCSFFGVIPDQFRNLTNLQTLDLGYNGDLLEFRKLDWLPYLSSLTRLDLSGSNISDPHAMQHIMKVTSLRELNLAYTNVFYQIISPSISLLVNSSFKHLLVLNLRGTRLTSQALTPWLFNASTNIVSLDLSLNQIEGPLPEAFGNLIFLEDLDLSYNKIEGTIPNSLWNLSNLESLNLASNEITGRFPSLEALSHLETFDVSHNSMVGTISEADLSKLHNLKVLGLSFNSFSLDVRSDWIPPFLLDNIKLARCNMGPNFPKWILTQRNVSQLDLSSNGIHGFVPDELWDLSYRFELLNLSTNQISGGVRDLSSNFLGAPMIDLSSNNFSGPLPLIHPNTLILQMSKNMFRGSISWTCTNTYNNLWMLDLSDNQLSGEIPDCWATTEIFILSLENNNFSGKLPRSLGSLGWLQILHLRNNNLFGELPSTLRNCTDLEIMDIGKNKIEGNIPSWIGTHLTSLTVLSLRQNEFTGSIPSNICHLNDIQILDLSSNRISGSIPQCFNNFTSMVQKTSTFGGTYILLTGDGAYNPQFYTKHALVQWKRQDSQFRKTLGLLKIIDLSSNRLTGSIPRETFLLQELNSLNLTKNHLTGRIDPDIGRMEMLESLDLSYNQFSGDIPTELGRLNYLSILDLSNNSLSGRIPQGTQLEGFTASAYAGNSQLCGRPLRSCLGDDRIPHGERDDDYVDEEDDKIVTKGFYISMAIGFILALWGTLVTMLLKISWRLAYFKFLDRIGDRMYFIYHKIKIKVKVIFE